MFAFAGGGQDSAASGKTTKLTMWVFNALHATFYKDALARWNADETPAEGDIAINVLIVPVGFLALLEVELPTDYTEVEVA
jgi:ABC-type glycerol-3-phosphate transport system substrate-binding protein